MGVALLQTLLVVVKATTSTPSVDDQGESYGRVRCPLKNKKCTFPFTADDSLEYTTCAASRDGWYCKDGKGSTHTCETSKSVKECVEGNAPENGAYKKNLQVLFVPGFGLSNLYLKNAGASSSCAVKLGIAVNQQVYPPVSGSADSADSEAMHLKIAECITGLLALERSPDGNLDGMDGAQIRSGLSGGTSVDDAHRPPKDLIEHLTEVGYEVDKSFRIFPYDFRAMVVDSNKRDDLCKRFQSTIETMKAENGGQKVAVITHSFGGLISFACFQSIKDELSGSSSSSSSTESESWFRNNIGAYVPIAVPFLGSVISILQIHGFTPSSKHFLGLIEEHKYADEKAMAIMRSWTGLLSLFPRGGRVSGDSPMIKFSEGGSMTPAEYCEAVKKFVAGYDEIGQCSDEEPKSPAPIFDTLHRQLPDGLNRVYALFGSGLATMSEITLTGAKDDLARAKWQSVANEDDGDNIVSNLSASLIPRQWQSEAMAALLPQRTVSLKQYPKHHHHITHHHPHEHLITTDHSLMLGRHDLMFDILSIVATDDTMPSLPSENVFDDKALKAFADADRRREEEGEFFILGAVKNFLSIFGVVL